MATVSEKPFYIDGGRPSEVYFIAHWDNLVSLLANGILSHKRAAVSSPIDISDPEVQRLRAMILVKNPDRDSKEKKSLVIHRYANLYIRAQNAMMYVRKDKSGSLCVLRIDPSILDREEVVIADKNAARNDANFHQATTFSFSPESSTMIQEKCSFVFDDKRTNKADKRKSVHQAEVLVPYQLHASYIKGIYVVSENVRMKILALFDQKCPVPVDIHPSLFFAGVKYGTNGFNPLEQITAQPLHNTQYQTLIDDLPSSSDEEGIEQTGGEKMDTVFEMDK
jgi:ssDNA thymidine ADP-ribosyltransferase, DarT